MTQYQLLQASPVLSTLATLKLPVKKSFAIYNLNKKAEDVKNFFIEEEKKLIDTYHGEVNEGGRISFKETEDFKGFNEKYAELKEMEVEGVSSITLKMSELGDAAISAAELAVLDGVIVLEDE